MCAQLHIVMSSHDRAQAYTICAHECMYVSVFSYEGSEDLQERRIADCPSTYSASELSPAQSTSAPPCLAPAIPPFSSPNWHRRLRAKRSSARHYYRTGAVVPWKLRQLLQSHHATSRPQQRRLQEMGRGRGANRPYKAEVGNGFNVWRGAWSPAQQAPWKQGPARQQQGSIPGYMSVQLESDMASFGSQGRPSAPIEDGDSSLVPTVQSALNQTRKAEGKATALSCGAECQIQRMGSQDDGQLPKGAAQVCEGYRKAAEGDLGGRAGASGSACCPTCLSLQRPRWQPMQGTRRGYATRRECLCCLGKCRGKGQHGRPTACFGGGCDPYEVGPGHPTDPAGWFWAHGSAWCHYSSCSGRSLHDGSHLVVVLQARPQGVAQTWRHLRLQRHRRLWPVVGRSELWKTMGTKKQRSKRSWSTRMLRHRRIPPRSSSPTEG